MIFSGIDDHNFRTLQGICRLCRRPNPNKIKIRAIYSLLNLAPLRFINLSRVYIAQMARLSDFSLAQHQFLLDTEKLHQAFLVFFIEKIELAINVHK